LEKENLDDLDACETTYLLTVGDTTTRISADVTPPTRKGSLPPFHVLIIISAYQHINIISYNIIQYITVMAHAFNADN